MQCTTETACEAPVRGRRVRRALAGGAVALAATFLLGWAMLPGLMTRRLVDILDRRAGLELTVDRAQVNLWRGSASFSGIKLSEPTDPARIGGVIIMKSLSAQVSLASLFGRDLEIGEVTIAGLHGQVPHDEAGETMFARGRRRALARRLAEAEEAEPDDTAEGESTRHGKRRGRGLRIAQVRATNVDLSARNATGSATALRFGSLTLHDLALAPAPEPLAGRSLTIAELRLVNATFSTSESNGEPLTIRDLNAVGRHFSWPQTEEGNVPSLEMDFAAVEANSRGRLAVAGDFLRRSGIDDLSIDLQLTDQALAGVPPFEAGLANATLRYRLAQGHAEGDLAVRMHRFRLAKDATVVSKTTRTALNLIGKAGLPEIATSFAYTVENATWMVLLNGFARSLRAAFDDALSGASSQVHHTIATVGGFLPNEGLRKPGEGAVMPVVVEGTSGD